MAEEGEDERGREEGEDGRGEGGRGGWEDREDGRTGWMRGQGGWEDRVDEGGVECSLYISSFHDLCIQTLQVTLAPPPPPPPPCVRTVMLL